MQNDGLSITVNVYHLEVQTRGAKLASGLYKKEPPTSPKLILVILFWMDLQNMEVMSFMSILVGN
jgi:hypothetical protein